ncbi:MAG TPA: hypothetical protein VFD36_12375 [Kofleriaceae bacterium]|nr:hypothetical protein [Kofleriaceae bacterium]
MIGLPFGTNDTTCLTAASEQAAELVEHRDPLLVEYAQQFRTTQEAYEHIRSLPQRDDEGAPDDGPKLEACEPVQRLRVPAPNPNCFERAVLGMILGELLDPHPVRQLATLEFPWGRHTILLENGYPIVLDPRVSAEEIENGVATGLASNVPEQPEIAERPETERSTKRAKKRNRVAIDVHDALEYTTSLGEEATRDQRNGPHRAWLARNAIRALLETRTPPTDAHTADALHWFFKQAEDVARMYGRRALTIVQTTAAAIWDLIDDVLAQQEKHEQRNISFDIGGSHYEIPNWLGDAASTLGKIGLNIGAAYARPYLLGAGITSEMLSLIEQELNAEGYSLGPLSKQDQSISAALAAIASKGK